MGVYIKDMEMPTEGYIDVRIKCNGIASFSIADNPYIKAVEAVPVPPHGRLIDEDELHSALRKRAKEFSDSEYGDGVKRGLADAREYIKIATTVIPAEDGE